MSVVTDRRRREEEEEKEEGGAMGLVLVSIAYYLLLTPMISGISDGLPQGEVLEGGGEGGVEV